MKIARIAYLVSAAALATLAVPASAAIITFSGLTMNGAPLTTYTEKGLTVSAPTGQYTQNTTSGNGDLFSLTNAQASGTLTLVSANGGQLFFNGFDARNAGTSAGGISYTAFIGANSLYSVNGALPANGQFTTYNNFRFIANPVDRITISYNCAVNQCSFDNINATGLAVTPTPAVPEPASWAMMIAGFGVVGGALRSRSRPALATA